jgi:hypothetical protein
MKLCLLLLCLFYVGNIYSQPYLEWESTYTSPSPVGVDNGHVITTDAKANVYVGGKVQGTSSYDYLLI